MAFKVKIFAILLAVSLLLSGCALRTLEELYYPPKRSEDYESLQSVIDEAMEDLSYSAPISGANQQAVQMADLDGDGVEEYLLFAKDDSENPLKILIFSQVASGYVLMDTIEGYGFAFDFVEYAQMDDREGVEIIVGRQVSGELARAVSVYRFTSGLSRQLLSTGYAHIAVTDLNENGMTELLLFHAGASDRNRATATLYGFSDGEIQRKFVTNLSQPITNLQQVVTGFLEDQTPAVFVTSLEGANDLVTDVFAVSEDSLVNLYQGIRTPAIHNYQLYPTDIDGDGVIELAKPVLMETVEEGDPAEYRLEWYSLDQSGVQAEKICTYQNYDDGWYMLLNKTWKNVFCAQQGEDGVVCFLRDLHTGETVKVMTILTLTGSNKEAEALLPGRVVLYKGDSVIYAVDLETAAADYGITIKYMLENFRPIRMEWNAEESEG